MTAEAGSFGFGCCTTPPLLLVVFVLSLLLLPQPVAASAITTQQSADLLMPLPTVASQVRCNRNPGLEPPAVKRHKNVLTVRGRQDRAEWAVHESMTAVACSTWP